MEETAVRAYAGSPAVTHKHTRHRLSHGQCGDITSCGVNPQTAQGWEASPRACWAAVTIHTETHTLRPGRVTRERPGLHKPSPTSDLTGHQLLALHPDPWMNPNNYSGMLFCSLFQTHCSSSVLLWVLTKQLLPVLLGTKTSWQHSLMSEGFNYHTQLTKQKNSQFLWIWICKMCLNGSDCCFSDMDGQLLASGVPQAALAPSKGQHREVKMIVYLYISFSFFTIKVLLWE